METPKDLIEQCTCTRVRTAARLVTRTYDNALRPAGLKASQLAVLAAVASAESASIAALSKALSMDRTTLSRNLQPLLYEKLVTLVEDGGGRSKSARITKNGEARLQMAIPLWRKAQLSLARQAGAGRLNELGEQLTHLIRTYN
jgi:DNA-binding MarR family transcriptional regulator